MRERENSLGPLFSPLGIKIVKLLDGYMGFCFEISTLRICLVGGGI